MPAKITFIDLTPKGLISSEETRRILECSTRYLERLVQMGKLHPVIFGTTAHGHPRWYKRSEVVQYKETHPRLGQAAS